MAGIFDFLEYVHQKNKPYKDIPEGDRKNLSIYMLNRWLSMADPVYTEVVNAIQPYNLTVLDKETSYEFYRHLFGGSKSPYIKYISKGKKGKAKGPTKELVTFLSREVFELSETEVKQYLKEMGKDEVKKILSSYGHSPDAIKKLIKGL